MVSPIMMMIPPPPPQMSMAALRAEFRRALDQPVTTPPNEAPQESSHRVDIRA
jgi:hypothetical protein